MRIRLAAKSLCVVVTILSATGCGSAFRSTTAAGAFPNILKSPDVLSPVAPDFERPEHSPDPNGQMSPISIPSGAVVVEERGVDVPRSQRWTKRVGAFAAAELEQRLRAAAIDPRGVPQSTLVVFEVMGRSRSLSGVGAGATDMIVHVESTLPSGDVVRSALVRSEFLALSDIDRMALATLPVTFGLSLVLSSPMLVTTMPPVAWGLMGTGAVLALGGAVGAAVFEQWLLREQEERWTALFERALAQHADELADISKTQGIASKLDGLYSSENESGAENRGHDGFDHENLDAMPSTL